MIRHIKKTKVINCCDLKDGQRGKITSWTPNNYVGVSVYRREDQLRFTDESDSWGDIFRPDSFLRSYAEAYQVRVDLE